MLLATVTLSFILAPPTFASDAATESSAVQIAAYCPAATAADNPDMTPARRPEINAEAASSEARKNAPPPAARAFFALGIALMMTPDMFGGAFSN
jgi:hypothetical protein